MKLQYLRLAFCDETNILSPSPSPSPSPSLTVNCKRLRPIAPKFVPRGDDADILTSLDLRSFNSPKPTKCIDQAQNPDASPASSSRWNPTQEQIRTLEELYRGGMRTPNAQQIERITAELSRHGRIEGKNVFYWFQNHKARERQRQKRSAALLALDAAPRSILALFSDPNIVGGKEEEAKRCVGGSNKRKRGWEPDEGDGTLELFPLHPERD